MCFAGVFAAAMGTADADGAGKLLLATSCFALAASGAA